MDSLKHVNEFTFLFNQNYGKICGINLKEDNNSFKLAGNIGRVTISTSAAGRGMDIKPQKETLDIGGLHVIIPFLMPNQRVEEQAIGRSGRQGQPGSVSIYRQENDRYFATPEFDPKYNTLINYQNLFSEHIHKNWPWLYSGTENRIKDLFYKFNSTVEDIWYLHSEILIKPSLINYAKKNKNDFIITLMNTIKISWSIFYEYIDLHFKDNIDFDKEYNFYLNKLYEYIPQKCSMETCFKHLVKKFGMEKIIDDILNPKPNKIFVKNNPTYQSSNGKMYEYIVVCEDLNFAPLIKYLTGMCVNNPIKYLIVNEINNLQLTHIGIKIDDTILEFGTGENSEPNYLKAFFGNEHGEITVNSTKHNWNYERFGKLIHGFTNIPPDVILQKCEESGQWNKYNLLNNNCHDFVKYCLTIIGAGIEKECLNIVLNPLRILYTLKMLLN